MQHFVEAARRMVTSLEPRPTVARQDPGDALIDLLGFVAQIRSFGPERPREALGFPPLAQVRARRLTAGPD